MATRDRVERLQPREIVANMKALYKIPGTWAEVVVLGVPDSLNRVPIFCEAMSSIGMGRGKGRYLCVRVNALRRLEVEE